MTVFKYNAFFIGVTGFVIIFLSPCLDLSLDGIGEVQNTGCAFSIASGVAADFFGFNSRSREGATSAVEIIRDELIVSIYTPVRERRDMFAKRTIRDGFNSRSREGAT